MVDIEDMAPAEIHSLLEKIEYGHLGCAHNGRPYVVPLHYVYSRPDIYFYTTEGMKTAVIAANPHVCLQVEEVNDARIWRSIIASGRAERVSDPKEREEALSLIRKRNPTLTPAIARTWIDVWGRANIEAIYRLRPETLTGRKTMPAR